VYDPVSRLCTLARAGHPAPALALLDGKADFIDVPAGPPLGLGGLPFESAEVELPEGSVIALFTDGLIQSREHDIDASLNGLRRALAQPAPSLQNTCDAVLKAALPAHPDDDVALLIARTGPCTPIRSPPGRFRTTRPPSPRPGTRPPRVWPPGDWTSWPSPPNSSSASSSPTPSATAVRPSNCA
jgi:hypothetical protein